MRGSKGQAYTIPPTDKVALSGRVGFHLINPTAACFELFPRNTNYALPQLAAAQIDLRINCSI